MGRTTPLRSLCVALSETTAQAQTHIYRQAAPAIEACKCLFIAEDGYSYSIKDLMISAALIIYSIACLYFSVGSPLIQGLRIGLGLSVIVFGELGMRNIGELCKRACCFFAAATIISNFSLFLLPRIPHEVIEIIAVSSRAVLRLLA